MIYRIPASKDTFVTNKIVTGKRVTGSNAGASEILQVYKIGSGTASGSAHILIAFPTASALAMYSASYSSGSISWYLTMKNVETENPNIGNFTLEIFPVSQSWSEGNGHDLDYWTDRGYANWSFSSNGVAWQNEGARPLTSSASATVSFDTGHEDLEVDVSSLIPFSQLGFWIGLTSSQESDVNEYYLKAFRSRQTHFPQYQPYLEARWNDATGSYSSSFVDVIDSTASLVGGTYNLRSVYDSTETPTIRLYLRPKDWNLAVVATGSSEASGTILTDAYYRLINDITDEVVVPFGTGTIKHTKLSYDDIGNYFKFPMQNLVNGLVYRFDIGYTDIEGDWHVFQDDMKFRVR
jgi:hypothetical protein